MPLISDLFCAMTLCSPGVFVSFKNIIPVVVRLFKPLWLWHGQTWFWKKETNFVHVWFTQEQPVLLSLVHSHLRSGKFRFSVGYFPAKRGRAVLQAASLDWFKFRQLFPGGKIKMIYCSFYRLMVMLYLFFYFIDHVRLSLLQKKLRCM